MLVSKKTLKKVRKIQAKSKGKVWKSQPATPKPMTAKQYEAWMVKFSKHFANELINSILNEIVEIKRAKKQ